MNREKQITDLKVIAPIPSHDRADVIVVSDFDSVREGIIEAMRQNGPQVIVVDSASSLSEPSPKDMLEDIQISFNPKLQEEYNSPYISARNQRRLARKVKRNK